MTEADKEGVWRSTGKRAEEIEKRKKQKTRRREEAESGGRSW